jgi:hypothetical protein
MRRRPLNWCRCDDMGYEPATCPYCVACRKAEAQANAAAIEFGAHLWADDWRGVTVLPPYALATFFDEVDDDVDELEWPSTMLPAA